MIGTIKIVAIWFFSLTKTHGTISSEPLVPTNHSNEDPMTLVHLVLQKRS